MTFSAIAKQGVLSIQGVLILMKNHVLIQKNQQNLNFITLKYILILIIFVSREKTKKKAFVFEVKTLKIIEQRYEKIRISAFSNVYARHIYSRNNNNLSSIQKVFQRIEVLCENCVGSFLFILFCWVYLLASYFIYKKNIRAICRRRNYTGIH